MTLLCDVPVTQLHQRDSVKVTGRHALCGDCLQAFADHINIKVEGGCPTDSLTAAGCPQPAEVGLTGCIRWLN